MRLEIHRPDERRKDNNVALGIAATIAVLFATGSNHDTRSLKPICEPKVVPNSEIVLALPSTLREAGDAIKTTEKRPLV